MNQTFAADISAVEKIAVVQQILEVVCLTTGLGFSAVARVTESNWVACAVRDEIQLGLQPGGELQIETTFCDSVRRSGEIVVFDHAAQDEIFCHHPSPKMYGFQSYISVPINLPDGRFFGTLCALDPQPTQVNTLQTLGMFKLFADLIGHHLDAQERIRANEAALLDERETARLREQFIAVLGHDLRNPLAAISAGIDILRTLPAEEDSAPIFNLLQRSAARMNGLISNVLDFARGRLGGGLSLRRTFDANLENALAQVVGELQAASPKRAIKPEFSIQQRVFCDSERLAQLLSNLLANALTHGAPDSPIRVKAQSDETGFKLSVTNRGPDLEPQVMAQLFEPFARGSARAGQQGLGLGLYIAKEIAHAHDGTLQVTSHDGEICFTFAMPAQTM